MRDIDELTIKEIYKERPSESKKYDFGLVLVIGGSEFYSGPPALSAMAAFKSGADMVRIIAPKRAADIIASFNPNMSAYPLNGKMITKEHLPVLLSMTDSARIASRGNVSVVIGGGVGRSEETQEVVLEYLSSISVPVVIDADAIYAIKGKNDIISNMNCLITPHYYEFAYLTDREIYDLTLEEKAKIIQEEAERLKTTILVKGKEDIVSNGDEVIINRLGSPYIAVGGCGDTLAGIAGTMLARKITTIESGAAAAYINSAAGILAVDKLRDSLVATDLIDHISEIIKK
jgi:ADP-dependent NAD(P)H-hydrate dehydratase / NAD(P)H-hydrate epimerase